MSKRLLVSIFYTAVVSHWFCPAFAVGALPPSTQTVEQTLGSTLLKQSKDPQATKQLIADLHSVWSPKLENSLESIALNPSKTPEIRSLSLMVLGSYSPNIVARKCDRLTQDKTWMIRSTTARLIGKSNTASSTHACVSKLLKDPSLIVRRETVESLNVHQVRAFSEELMATLEDPRNFQNGEPLWVPTRVLSKLREASCENCSEKLTSLARKSENRSFRTSILATLSALKNPSAPAEEESSQ